MELLTVTEIGARLGIDPRRSNTVRSLRRALLPEQDRDGRAVWAAADVDAWARGEWIPPERDAHGHVTYPRGRQCASCGGLLNRWNAGPCYVCQGVRSGSLAACL